MLDTAPKNNLKEGKPRMSVVPLDIIMELAPPGYLEGIEKYVQESWRKGFKLSDLHDALQRHECAFFYKGEDFDPDPLAQKYKKHHLSGALFCILAMYWTWKTRPDLDDRPYTMAPSIKLAYNNEKDKKENPPMEKPLKSFICIRGYDPAPKWWEKFLFWIK